MPRATTATARATTEITAAVETVRFASSTEAFALCTLFSPSTFTAYTPVNSVYQTEVEMPRGPGSPLRPRKGPLTDHLIQASVDGGMDQATGFYRELVYGGLATHERADEIRKSLHRCAKYLGYSMKAKIEGTGQGYQVRFVAIDKAKGRAYIAAKYKDRPHELPYNPYARRSE